jgi:pimeloyl-ACP methyl ester carboxylesterase
VLAVVLVAAACSGNDSVVASVTSSTPTAHSLQDTVAAATVVSPPDVPSFVADACRFDVPPGRFVRCGWLEVPADRSDPAKGEVRIHVAVFESPGLDPAPDPVVFLQGGPGGFALENLQMMFETSFGHLLADRDVIIYDQRGVGYSEPALACPEMAELRSEIVGVDVPDDEAALLRLEAIEDCHNRLVASGVDLAAYTSAASADDLVDLREALGISEWNLYGISYGTRLALTVMRDHPEGIRSVILDSAYPPDVDLIADTPENLDRSLRALFDGCAADDDCAAAYPDLEADFYALLRELDEEPLRAPVADVASGVSYEAVFDGSAFGGVVFGGLYHAQIIPDLPRMISDTAAGDTFLLSSVASSVWAGSGFVSFGMQISVQCSEEVPFTSRGALNEVLGRHPELAVVFLGSPNLGPGVFDVCDLWGIPPQPAEENEAVVSDIPSLVLAGEFDPVTPPSWGERAAGTLGAATFVEFPGAGHGPSASLECPQSVLREFLADPDGRLETGCIGDMGGPGFITPGHLTGQIELEPFTHEMLGVRLSGVAPARWTRQGSGTWTRSVSALDQTTIIQQPVPGASPAEVVASAVTSFGISNDPAGEYETEMGSWTLYEGTRIGGPVIVAVLGMEADTVLVALLASPSEVDRLRNELLFPVLDAVGHG